ncbi:MAG: VRR-NUC domain-containing protein [Peptostreptococcaceae bacterium]|nr:VRR-NUC domain-containing protein [Peptostreptococcaceae bacterium]
MVVISIRVYPNGFSDLAGFRKSDGKMIFLEIKKKGGKTSEAQKHFISEMSKYPVIVAVVRSPEDAIKIVMEG